jgi:hypothetical protein
VESTDLDHQGSRPADSARTGRDRHAGDIRDLTNEVAGRADADRHGADGGLAVGALQPAGRGLGDLRVEHDVEIGVGQAPQVVGRGAQRRGDVDPDAEALQQARDFDQVVAVAKAQRGRAQDIAQGGGPPSARGGGTFAPRRQGAHHLIEGFRAPQFSFF